MRSLIFGSLALALVLVAPPAAADPFVTTGETDSGEPNPFVVIVDPLDGAIIAGTPDALVPVAIEFWTIDLEAALEVDDKFMGWCSDPSPCTMEVTLTPGPHTLTASIGGDSHTITVTVMDDGSETTDTSSGSATDTSADTDPTGSATDSGATTEAPGGSEGTSSTEATSSDGASGGDSDGEKGCACSTGSGAPDILGLALAALLAPWRRRRDR